MNENVPLSADLPDELLSHEQWVCWRSQQRNGKQTKVPVNPATGSFASTTDPDSWTAFESARTYARDGSADGVGFVFSDTDPFVGVDLDDCRIPETGLVTDEATEIIEALASYTEVSPSGTGVHVILSGGLPGDRNRRDWVELYDDARFFTMTGDHIDGTPATIEARTDEVATIHATYIAQTEATTESATEKTPSSSATTAEKTSNGSISDTETGTGSTHQTQTGLTDNEVRERAQNAANGDKFTRLWQGQTTGYNSHSEADMALCALLAFWTGGDRTQMDRLFRRSGLMREKWDERHFADGSTYGEKTIDRVLAGTDEFYNPDRGATSAERDTSRDTSAPDSQSTAKTVALKQELAALTAREENHLTVISELRDQVERLEAENERLQDEIAAERANNTETGSDTGGGSSSIISWLKQLLGRRQ